MQIAKAENLQGSLLMVEQSSPPTIQGADRSDPWRALITLEFETEMIQHRTQNELRRIQRRSGHLQEANLQGHRQPVHRPAPPSHLRQFGSLQREKLFDLKRRQGVRESLKAKITIIPAYQGSPGGKPIATIRAGQKT